MTELKTHNNILVSIGLALLIPLLTINTAFPYFGIAVYFLILTIVGVIYKPNSIENLTLAGVSTVLALFFVIRTNPLLLFFSFVGLIYSTSLLHSNLKDKYRPYLLPVLPIINLVIPFLLKGGYESYKQLLTAWRSEQPNVQKQDNKKEPFNPQRFGINLLKNTTGGLIGLCMLVVLGSLFALINPFFLELFLNSFSWIGDILTVVFELFSPLFFFRLLISLPLLFVIPKYILMLESEESELVSFDILNHQVINYVIPKVMVAVLTGVFIISQFQLYTASVSGLEELGITAADRVNEVFGQLSWAVLIILGLLFFDVARSRFAKIASYVLLSGVVVLSGFALYSNLYYIEGFGLSISRLYGLAIIVWLSVLTAILTIKNISNVPHTKILKYASLTSLSIVTLIGVVNFDAQIYSYNQSTFDDNYSFDAIPAESFDSNRTLEVLALENEYLESNEDPDYSLSKPSEDDRVYRAQYNKIENNQRIRERKLKQVSEKYCDRIPLLSFNVQEYRIVREVC
jgi:hypothetical protein